MGYEDAPATRMLASHCAACGRPLVDAISVSIGMGPDCREKHGFNMEVDEAKRGAANKIVHEIALRQEGIEVLEGVHVLRSLGFEVLADRIIKRLRPIVIEQVNEKVLALQTPYSETLVADLRNNVPSRRWDKENKQYLIGTEHKRVLWELLKRHFPGASAIGPKGVFTL
jgi:hypothetical protein